MEWSWPGETGGIAVANTFEIKNTCKDKLEMQCLVVVPDLLV